MSRDQTPQRPYLYRALHEWMTDNGETPHIVADARYSGTVVPSDFVKDGRIVLNISYAATQALELGNDAIRFRARFAGRPFDVCVPAMAVLAIYSRESGEGMVFGDSPSPDPVSADDDGSAAVDAEASAQSEKPGRTHLRVIK